jgi:hypothetical protein
MKFQENDFSGSGVVACEQTGVMRQQMVSRLLNQVYVNDQ